MEISEDVKKAIRVAKAIATENSNPKFSSAHLLRGILHKESGLFSQLNNWGEDPYFMEEWAEVRIESCPKGRIFSEPTADEFVTQILVEAENLSINLGKEEIDSVSILGAISTAGVGFNYEQLKTFPLNRVDFLSKVQSINTINTVLNKDPSAKIKREKYSDNILKYCIDLLEQNLTGEADLFIGREQELISISEILCRKSKPNVIITGEPGVGKTAIVRGLANKISENNIPVNLKNGRIFTLDHNALVAGIAYKGEVEDRFRGIVKDMSRFDFPILFIDDVHQMFDPSLCLHGVINIIKRELSKKSFILIATTLTDEFRKKLEPDTALMRWCETISISEPEIEECTEIIAGIISEYADHHLVQWEEKVIIETIKLTKRYFKEKNLPDAAIDILDRTMAAIQFMYNMAPNIAASFDEKLATLKASQAGAEAYEKLHKSLMNNLNYLTISQIDQEPETKEEKQTHSAESVQKTINQLLALSSTKEVKVSVSHIAFTISKICGIPAGELLSGERDRLIQMEDHLQRKVIGQDQAVKVLADAIFEARSGLTRPEQPIGSFFLLGPTGTGKTELAKQLAEFLFQSSEALIRFDMSEFKEEHSAALLYGAPPGYVGYEEGGLLVKKIRQQPYAVVLFDEIEKAHSSVFDLFLQILDEGKIHDKLGRQGDFSNAVILFTSNIGSKKITAMAEKEMILPTQTDLTNLMSLHFRPEFLGRLSGMVPFLPIKKENVITILKLQLKELESLLSNQGIELIITEAAAEALASEGYSSEYGARPLRGVIRNHLKTPLSRMLITGKIASEDIVLADLNEQGEITLTINPLKFSKKPEIKSEKKEARSPAEEVTDKDESRSINRITKELTQI